MPKSQTNSRPISETSDDIEWAERSEYWRTYKPVTKGRQKKFHYREPIILCGHGVRIRVDRGTLLIQDGFTHFPQGDESRRYFPGDPDLPSRIVVLDANGGISFDALEWLSQQKIVLVQLDWRGDVIVVGGGTGYRADDKLTSDQLAAKSGKKCIELSRHLIRGKFIACIDTLRTALPESPAQALAIQNLERDIRDIDQVSPTARLSTLLGLEGRAAGAYFRAWHALPLRWIGLSRRPIPESWRRIGPRNMTWKKSPRNARHPVNAMLNYGYGMLTSELRIQCIAVGLDPSIGIIHGNADNKTPLIYDLMEPLRPLVDREILKLAQSHIFTPGDFTINSWGGCRLNPQMARVVAERMTFGKDAERVVGWFRSIV